MTRSIQPLLLATGMTLATATTSPCSDLATLRTSHLESSAAAAAPEFQRYHAALSKLENALAAKKDYPAAIHVQRERLRIAAKIESLGAPQTPGARTSSASSSIVLDLASASTGSGVSYDPASGTLVGWTAAGSYAEWTLPDHPMGGYEIELTYSTSSTAPGTFILSGSFYTLTRETVTNTANATFTKRTVGPLRLKSGTGPFRITAGNFTGTSLFTLKSVRIAPLKP